jgi:hypothetical protein
MTWSALGVSQLPLQTVKKTLSQSRTAQRYSWLPSPTPPETRSGLFGDRGERLRGVAAIEAQGFVQKCRKTEACDRRLLLGVGSLMRRRRISRPSVGARTMSSQR